MRMFFKKLIKVEIPKYKMSKKNKKLQQEDEAE